MKTILFVVAALIVSTFTPAHAQLLLKPIASIPVPRLKDGDFDHFAIDLAGHRLFLTAEANGAVEVFDTHTNKLIHSITGLVEPHSILYRADLGRMFVVDGGASEVKIYDSKSYNLVGRIKLSIDADSIAYDPKTTFLYIVNGGREAHTPYSFISVVDTSKAVKVADIKIESNWLEALAVEHKGTRLFINETGSNQVGVMNRNSRTIVGAWPIPADTSGNSAMKFDEANHRLFIATRKSPKFIVLDSDTGKVISSMDCVPMVDDINYDPRSKRIYLSGDKFVDIIQQQDADHYKKIGVAVGSFRAKTAILVPELRRYYLAAPKNGASEARVLVYDVSSHGVRK